MAIAAVGENLQNEQLIAQLLENDLLLLQSFNQAEKLQLEQVLVASSAAQERDHSTNLETSESFVDADAGLAFELYVADARISNDAAYAQEVQNEANVKGTLDHQYALKLAAAERKSNFDALFARKLQEYDNDGRDIDQVIDAESVLGTKSMLDLTADDTGVKDHDGRRTAETKSVHLNLKGKARQLNSAVIPDEGDEEEVDISSMNSSYPTCGICLDVFLAVRSPYTVSLAANSSARLPYGLRLPCPQEHGYCIFCLTSYIQSKLDPDGKGVGRSIVFPIRCPECPLDVWVDGISDEVAERVLGESGMVPWHHQRILDSVPRLFCPNPKCSLLVEADEDSEEPHAMCPGCQQLMCVPCRARWHFGLSCEAYKALPLDERSPEDRAVLELAKAEQWRRCPNCAVIVEHISGCNHMTCRCGFHFCFKCGSPTTKEGRCKRNPPCELWDEDMLLEENERARNRPLNAPPPPVIEQPVYARDHAAPLPARRIVHPPAEDLAWMTDPGVLCARHWFTNGMINNLTCGYCNQALNSLADLRYHLLHVRHHPVYACCGRFFKHRADFERHQVSMTWRFGGRHSYQIVRE